ncbi:MAG: penicillin-binding protein [Erysipelotrichaceae bacterium]|nr:penicillin-binding protein [Erysipelotrichaceae bacterium]
MPRIKNNSVREIFLVTLAAIVLLASNVFFVTISKVHLRSGQDLSGYANSANYVHEINKALRGNIYDRNGSVIAQDSRTYNIICILDPNRPAVEGTIAHVADKEGTAEILSKVLRMDYDKILDYLNQDVYQTELGYGGRKLSKAVKDEIESYDLPGIEFTDSVQRIYPMGQFASNLIGYAQSDDTGSTTGRMGIELYLDPYLSGTDGSRTYQADEYGYVLPGMKEEVISARNGNHVYLTLDAGIQESLEEGMKTTMGLYQTQRVWGGAMEIATGKVIAWGQSPSFDPNTLENITDYTNTGAQMAYEPGSTMKSFVWAATINENRYDETMVTDGNQFCFNGDEYNNPVRTYSTDNIGCIYNAGEKQYGMVDLDHGMIYSLNTVAATLENELITPDIYLAYLKKFGFFSNVDTDGLPESSGLLNFTYAYDKMNLSFGQGSTATMLQLFQAYSAIFSDGTMVKPYFVESVRDSYDNSIIYQAETTVKGNPITEETARHMQRIMYRVINDEDGTAKWYRIPECDMIAKTGTSEVAINGSYENARTITSVMCAMPADNPQVLAYYAFEADNAKDSHYYVDAQKNFFRKIAVTYGFAEGSSTSPQPETPAETVELSEMPSLINHSIDYAQRKLSAAGASVYVLGEGQSVIRQYPQPLETLATGQRVFLLTDTQSFLMPDLTGWTRKDVAGLWDATGFGFQLSGTGKVVSQSIPPGTAVTKGTEIRVVFE